MISEKERKWLCVDCIKCHFRDSVRVDGVGAASITEVSFQEIAVTKEEAADQIDPNTEVAKLQEQIDSLKHRIKELNQKKQRIEGHEVLLDDFCKSLIDSGKTLGTGALLNKETIGTSNILASLIVGLVWQNVDSYSYYRQCVLVYGHI